jgi:hypothetical protein
MAMRSEAVFFVDDGDIPNNPLPLIVYPGVIDPETADPAAFPPAMTSS